MAQERHELQEIGDDLDSKIKKAEDEIPAMENTLRVISAANDCYKRNLDSIDSNSKLNCWELVKLLDRGLKGTCRGVIWGKLCQCFGRVQILGGNLNI